MKKGLKITAIALGVLLLLMLILPFACLLYTSDAADEL